ncbi:undecaprenyldiphospho-muramoylpentapeptide beta-N-acetylglucosaminyltransferase [Oceanidesulfovibrio indonesiensis]|uniref:UDP-N-acetylglucosamine--N-acetylmuramyl-(pentapeptide) pyrophosphoryl-undecaprenol N-acetylglucosamine transferase n=1 Tax=Oceanidesulfovibrio indonesiensis TaxID=54767 RepID=A0A7M3MJP4_9BACT|nr:undecaprenyldiphospho-muramoylpentapeptide beta-N-acetylglucosaminyltransferase [Oceanidesulfovibrio indonesiensis]TVM20043.1 undecaprenyldiphospho-muramoylpentapeptide beta-N-acetylglucosaminyltransferase [Oceanidesulfovibrio indonesiensis]
MSRVILTTGGTGGHIFPALAVAEEIAARNPECRLLFVGTRRGPEGDLARRRGLEFKALPSAGVLGRGLRSVSGLLSLATGLALAVPLVLRFKPDAVIGFGGYASFAAVAAAYLLRKPTALHEQNSVPGVANRLLGKLVRTIFLSFPDTQRRFPEDRTELVGNPVRKDIRALANKSAKTGDDTGRLLVLGGSQGATALNDAMLEALPALLEAGIEIIHQTGPRDFERVRQGYEQLKDQGADASSPRAFIEDMAGAYAWADLAVCRSGASTVFELAASGTPAVFVPFPYATHDHQRVNAEYLATAGAGVLVLQKDLNGEKLAQMVIELTSDRERLAAMAKAAKGRAMPEAATTMAQRIEALAA